MIELFLPLITSGLGMIGAGVQRRHERKMGEIANERLKIEFAHEFRLTELNMQAKREENEQQIALDEVRGANEAFKASYEAVKGLNDIKWGKSKLGDIANFTRAITRPLITYTLTIATWCRARSYGKMVEGMVENDLDMARLVYEQMAANPFDLALMSMTGLAIAWWFGSRGSRTSYKDAHYTRT